MNKILFLLLLSSCANTNEEWSCPARKGKPCKSISYLESSDNETNSSNNSISIKKSKTKYGKVLSRSDEEIITILFAPFIDESGNKHHTSKMDVVISKPDWKID